MGQFKAVCPYDGTETEYDTPNLEVPPGWVSVNVGPTYLGVTVLAHDNGDIPPASVRFWRFAGTVERTTGADYPEEAPAP